MSTEEVREYFNPTLMDHELLKPDEERDLLRKIHADCDGRDHVDVHGGPARDEFIQRNMRLVLKVTRRFARENDPRFVSLASAGTLGLMRGIDLFDVSARTDKGKPYRFSTYGVWWIQSMVREELGQFDPRVIRHRSYHDQFNRAREELVLISGDPNIPDETVYAYLTDVMKWKDDKLRTFMADRDRHTVTLETISEPTHNDEAHPIRVLLATETSDLLNEALKVLDFDEIYLLLQHYVAGETYDDIARDFDRCRERIRQKENEALRKLWLALYKHLG